MIILAKYNMRYNGYLLFLLLLLSTGFLKAQSDYERDSLESALPLANDLQRADILIGLANCLRIEDTTRAGNFARLALVLSNKLNYCKGKANAHVMLGVLLKNHGNQLGAKEQYLTGLKLATECKEPYPVSFAYHSLGNLAYLQGNYPKAMRYYIASVRISEQLGDVLRAARTFNNIGSLYMELQDQEQAEKYYRRSLNYYQGTNNDLMIAEIGINLANIYQTKGFHLKALYHYYNSLEVFRKKGSISDISSAVHNIGLVYLVLKQPHKAIPYLTESYKLEVQSGNQQALVLPIANLINAYLDMNRIDSADYYANQGLQLIGQVPNLVELPDLYASLGDWAGQKGNQELRDRYLTLKQKAEQKLIGQDKKAEVGEVTEAFESDRNEQQIKLLAKENEVNQLRIIDQ